METTLVILAAGLGSRFGGNKQISHVGPSGEILMEYSIHDAIKAGFTQVVIILKEEMIAAVRETVGRKFSDRIRVDYAVQDDSTIPAWYHKPADRQKPLGTVHAVLAAKHLIGGNFATVNADDYYGREAFRLMYRLLTKLNDPADAAMVPYILGNTMSENGGVSRGICDIRGGVLQSVAETHDIHYTASRNVEGEYGPLSPGAMVSMNLWGLRRDFLDRMEVYFHDFLRALPEAELKAECLLPVMVGDLLKSGELRVRAEASPDQWFGITYQADRESVIAELQKLHQDGVYPAVL